MKVIKLGNGLRVALKHQPSAKSASVNVMVRSGNANESRDVMGISHFIEHIVFKGTTSRSQQEIYERSDLMGGTLNAFTSKEYTCFYARVLDYRAAEILDIICDMVASPALKTEDIESEKGVVLEEIGMYEDSPEELAADMQTELAWQESPLSFNILGTRETVKGLNAEKLKSFMSEFYVPERMVVSICGKFDRDEILGVIEKRLGVLRNHGNPPKICAPRFNGGVCVRQKEIEQTHISYAFKGVGLDDNERYAAAVYSSLVGGGSASPLNFKIREELGLAYSVYSFHTAYTGCGMFGVGAALSAENQEKFLRESSEIIKSSRENIDENALYRVKEQIKSALVMSDDSVSGIASSIGRQLLLTDRYVDAEKTAAIIDSLTVSDIKKTAQKITDGKNIAVSVVGSPKEPEFYRNVLNELFV